MTARIFINPSDTSAPYGYDEPKQQDLIDAAIKVGWKEITDTWPLPPTTAELATTARYKRDDLINAVQRRIDRYNSQVAAGTSTNDSAAMFTKILTYTQALRDVPKQSGFPSSINWPVVPA